MTPPHAPVRDARLIAFYVVVVAFMVVSIGGQIQTTAPRIGGFFAFLWAVGNDAGAMLALDCLMTAAKASPVKKWAWVAILLAAGSGGAFNAYHVMVGVPGPAPAPFPLPLGLVLGLESILMILVLSHIVSTERAVREASRPHRHEGRRETATSTETHREAAPRPHDRDTATAAAETGSSLVAAIGTPCREAITAGAATTPLPRVELDVAPAQQLPTWAPPELADAVEASIRATDGGRKNYGVPSLQRDHRLPDGKKIGSHRATALLAHVDQRMEVAA